MKNLRLASHRFTRLFTLLAAGLCLSTAAGTAHAFQFNSGSTGVDGPIIIDVDTILPLPPDGVIHATDVTVAAGATLRFAGNALNTPVYLLASGAVVINGVIDVSGSAAVGQTGGLAGPGGWGGGAGGGTGMPGGVAGSNGFGPYGGRDISFGTRPGGAFGFGTANWLEPVGGSGGSGGTSSISLPGGGGGGGGGAILIAANNSISGGGTIRARGGLATPAGASINLSGGVGGDGAVRLVSMVTSGGLVLDVGTGQARVDALQDTTTSPAAVRDQIMVGKYNGPSLQILSVGNQLVTQGQVNSFTFPVGAPLTQQVVVRLDNAPPNANFGVRLWGRTNTDGVGQLSQYVNTTGSPGPHTVTFDVNFSANKAYQLYVFSY